MSLLGSCSKSTSKEITEISTRLHTQYGISLQSIKTVDQLPKFNQFRINNREVDAKLIPATDDQYFDYLKIVDAALKKYPASLTRKHIKKIAIGGSLTQDGAVIAGLYDHDTLYLFYNQQFGENSPLFLEQTIHHEFSSILIEKYDFPAFDWLKLNPANFEYIINPVMINNYVKNTKSYNASPKQLQQGMVSSYGITNAENDINTYAELAFTQPETMKAHATKYAIVAKKYQMIKQFYLSISPEFSKIFDSI